jgi:hypothetical protein
MFELALGAITFGVELEIVVDTVDPAEEGGGNLDAIAPVPAFVI